jgi:tRNA A37 threonylcarbamoyltransferase TsaD
MAILGIESSCDDAAAAIVTAGGAILSRFELVSRVTIEG